MLSLGTTPVFDTISKQVQFRMQPNRVLIFDLDGVISSEQIYWDSAAGAVDYIRFGSASNGARLSADLIAHIKTRAVNSNWDLAYLAVCCYILASKDDFNRFQQAERIDGCGFEEIFRLAGQRDEVESDELIASLS